MGHYRVVWIGILVAVAGAQDCGVDTSLAVGSTEEAATLAASLESCSDGEFTVEWNGEVSVAQTIHVTSGTSLTITGDGSGAVVDGGSSTQLFVVDGGSTLHLSDVTCRNGYAPDDGGAIAVDQSTVSFSGNVSFMSNTAGSTGGAISASDSTVSWDGDGTTFTNNFAVDTGGAIAAAGVSTVTWVGDYTAFSNNSVGSFFSDGGAIAADSSIVFWACDGTEFSNNSAGSRGGAIYANEASTVSWEGDGTVFSNNYAALRGGAISTDSSNVSWVGDGTQFISNSADNTGGAISADSSNVSWKGDHTQFSHNIATYGGAVDSLEATVSWEGDGTEFINNSAGFKGGAIFGSASTVSWVGDDTEFSINSAGIDGGAIEAESSSNVDWIGNGTKYISNSASDGGAIFVSESTVSWGGDSTEFISNFADEDGGAVFASGATIFLDKNTTFRSNVASGNGGAIALSTDTVADEPLVDVEFIGNEAGLGGAIYMLNNEYGISFTNVTLRSNSASEAGGAVVAYVSGVASDPVTFSGCIFSNNKANGTGGAVETLLGEQQFDSCEFEGNSAGEKRQAGLGRNLPLRMIATCFHQVASSNSSSTGRHGVSWGLGSSTVVSGILFLFLSSAAILLPAHAWTFIGARLSISVCPDIGGAMRLGGSGAVSDCSFLSNSASTRGLAVAMVRSMNFSGCSFDRNELFCAAGLYGEEAQEVNGNGHCKYAVQSGNAPDKLPCVCSPTPFITPNVVYVWVGTSAYLWPRRPALA